mgnify:CR=1 FL=1
MRDAVLDDEARGELGEVGALRRGLRRLLLRLADQLVDVDALESAVLQAQLGGTRERLFMALTALPPVWTSSAMLPLPSSISLLSASLSSGPSVDADEVRLEREADWCWR